MIKKGNERGTWNKRTIEKIKGKRKEGTRKGNEGRRKDKSNKKEINWNKWNSALNQNQT